MKHLELLWQTLQTHPLEIAMGIGLTLGCFVIANFAYQSLNRPPLLQPVLIATLMIIIILVINHVSYQQYFYGGQFLNHLLGPVIVALAVPLYQNFRLIIQWWWPLCLAIVLGGSITTLIAVITLSLFTVNEILYAPMWSKSITTAIAIKVTAQIGGSEALAATYVLITGILAAMVGPWIFDRVKEYDPAIRGTCYGVYGHAVGTTKALEESNIAAAFAGIAMGLMGLFYGIVLPVILLNFY